MRGVAGAGAPAISMMLYDATVSNRVNLTYSLHEGVKFLFDITSSKIRPREYCKMALLGTS